MRFSSSKTFGHEVGLSCAFRQWRATSHCQFLHGYALAVRLDFEADELDACGWVMDFGALGGVRNALQATFDHKTLVALDDPDLDYFKDMERRGLMRLSVVPATGCEAFARHVAGIVGMILDRREDAPRVRLVRVEVREHGANAAAVTL